MSRTDSVAHVLIPSLLCELQAEIQAKALDGRLTESDLAIAPKVSYRLVTFFLLVFYLFT